MCAETAAIVDFDVFESKLAEAIENARSLEEIETWLKSQQFVESVQLADYLLKSNPAQRDFFVRLRMQDGSTNQKIVNVFDLGNEQFRFHQLRDR